MVYYDIEFPKNREHEAVTEVCSQAMNQGSTVGGKGERSRAAVPGRHGI